MDLKYGKYRALVVDRDDPQGQGRLRVKSTGLSGGQRRSDEIWATACLPPGYMALPEVGDTVWIEFEEGDSDRPLWTGCAWSGGVGPQPSCSIQLDRGGRVRILAAAEVELMASRVEVTAPLLDVVGVVQCTTLIASQGVVSPSYTPGVGNI